MARTATKETLYISSADRLEEYRTPSDTVSSFTRFQKPAVMAGFHAFLMLTFASLIHATPYNVLLARQEQSEVCPTGLAGYATDGALCIETGGEDFVSSLCGAFPPLVTETFSTSSTSTIAVTVTSAAQTVYTPPPFTRTRYSFVTATSGNVTTQVATTVVTDTTTATNFICPASSFTAVALAAIAENYKRQEPSGTPDCLTAYQRQRGEEGIRDACSCLVPGQASSTTSITRTNVITSRRTQTQLGTTTIRGTTFYTNVTTATATVLSTETRTITVPRTIAATSTRTITRTISTSLPSPTPARFRIYYNATSPSSTSTTRIYGARTTAPADPSVYEIAFTPRTLPDEFALNSASQLVDLTFFRTITTRNRQDPYPFVFLNAAADAQGEDGQGLIVPMCSVCDGELTCGSDYQFAVCLEEGLLALGPDGDWAVPQGGNGTVDGGDEACTIVRLGVEAVGLGRK
ncbi:unnamed protein product [Zymoseptoria tritici ST99CH_1A5]|uniref:Uncharacterized protein n=1 Tax=Zymoseptoria tritici ST99CH_1A5 TaxID=1276529 RepID=A0A1Y6LJT7_ZYMTR|nr:unnamed protein product [Zymoseptoria tritici ST99CH_3D1]SMY23698.1 unnamed protein product [Zymoseptoria tritici ST99CH_1A5]